MLTLMLKMYCSS